MSTIKDYRRCASSGLELSVIGLGCWSFGGGQYWGNQDQKDVDQVVHAAIDCGINYFDTAEAYNDGRSETSLGLALRGGKREDVIIGSKITPANCYPGQIEKHCEDSLRRLQTDYLDIYMLHWPINPRALLHYTSEAGVSANPPTAALTFETLCQLQKSGKIRQIGISNFSRSRMQADIPDSLSVAVNQLPYNLLCRAIEFDTLPWCAQQGIGIIGYMTLLQGILAGAYPTLRDIPEMRRRTRHFAAAGNALCRHGESGFEEATQEAIAAIDAIARDTGLSMAELSTRWAVANPGITCALVGARNIEQLMANVKAVREPLDVAVVERLNEVSNRLKLQMGNHFDYYESAPNDRTL